MQSSKFTSRKQCFLLVMYFFLIMNVLSATAHGQQPTPASPSSQLNSKGPSVLINLQFGPAQNAAIRKKTGQYSLKPVTGFYVGAGIDFRTRLYRQFFLITGFGGGMYSRNVFFNAPAAKINPTVYTDPFERVVLPSVDFLVSLPMLLEKQFQVKEKQTAFFLAGANLRYSLGYDNDGYGYSLMDTNNQWVDLLSLQLNGNNYKKPWVNYNLGGGYDWVLKNGNVLRAGLLANVSFQSFITGSYEIKIPNEPTSTGTYRFSGTSIGLSVSYGFTGANRKYVQAYEKQNNIH